MADRHLKYDHWKLLYQEVLVEHRPQELRRKIQSAEAAIYQRLQAMAHNASDQSERQVIADAVFTLRILQRGKLFPEEIYREQMDAPPCGVELSERRSVGRTAIVVDDNAAIRQAISQAFLADGFGVCATAESGADAIDLVERLKPDVIILDLAMPAIDGLQTAPHLRKVAPDTPIILFTLYDYEVPMEQAAAIGLNLVQSKTDNIFSVVSKARELIEKQAAPSLKSTAS